MATVSANIETLGSWETENDETCALGHYGCGKVRA